MVAAVADCRDLGVSPSSPPTTLVGEGEAVAGTDVSHYQGLVPWKTLRDAGLKFVFIKATQGSRVLDPAFHANWQAAKACGIPRGAYHLFDPSEPADVQQRFYLAQLGDDYGELPPALDVELPYKRPFPNCNDYVAGVVKWLRAVEHRVGRRPVVYFQSWFHADVLCGDTRLAGQPLWAAGQLSEAFSAWPWTFWQHGQPASWAGRQWDRDRFNGTDAALRVLLRSAGD